MLTACEQEQMLIYKTPPTNDTVFLCYTLPILFARTFLYNKKMFKFEGMKLQFTIPFVFSPT